ncbi:hypothetical protein [Ilyobacter polytropus]|uniref:hypothetical protein n=1 Tax=Ilyobacter polytropus TaxID=167642 RepID=UPI0002E95E47|nr:hypothetical protein [Ilyobacter polytropus]
MGELLNEKFSGMVKKTFKNKIQDKAAIKQEVAMEARLKRYLTITVFTTKKKSSKKRF